MGCGGGTVLSIYDNSQTHTAPCFCCGFEFNIVYVRLEKSLFLIRCGMMIRSRSHTHFILSKSLHRSYFFFYSKQCGEFLSLVVSSNVYHRDHHLKCIVHARCLFVCDRHIYLWCTKSEMHCRGRFCCDTLLYGCLYIKLDHTCNMCTLYLENK
jgi:hypothetical protein